MSGPIIVTPPPCDGPCPTPNATFDWPQAIEITPPPTATEQAQCPSLYPDWYLQAALVLCALFIVLWVYTVRKRM